MAKVATTQLGFRTGDVALLKPNFYFLFSVFFVSLFTSNSYAKVRTNLDTISIHEDYKNGDFEKVILILENFRKTKKACTLSERLFIEKHLAVVYAANPATRERGRYHMYKLLDLAGDANLLEMFVGEELDGVFEKVRKEHEATKLVGISEKSSSAEKSGTSVISQKEASIAEALDYNIATLNFPDLAVADSISDPSWKSPGTWIGGGAALVVLALTIYYSDSSKEQPAKTYVVPANASR